MFEFSTTLIKPTLHAPQIPMRTNHKRGNKKKVIQTTPQTKIKDLPSGKHPITINGKNQKDVKSEKPFITPSVALKFSGLTQSLKRQHIQTRTRE